MNTQTLRWSDIEMSEGSAIQTLSSNEVEEVSGGLGWIPVIAIVVRVVSSPVARAVARGAIAAVSAYAGYEAVKSLKN